MRSAGCVSAQVDGAGGAGGEEVRLCSGRIFLWHHPVGAHDLADSLGGPGPLAGKLRESLPTSPAFKIIPYLAWGSSVPSSCATTTVRTGV